MRKRLILSLLGCIGLLNMVGCTSSEDVVKYSKPIVANKTIAPSSDENLDIDTIFTNLDVVSNFTRYWAMTIIADSKDINGNPHNSITDYCQEDLISDGVVKSTNTIYMNDGAFSQEEITYHKDGVSFKKDGDSWVGYNETLPTKLNFTTGLDSIEDISIVDSSSDYVILSATLDKNNLELLHHYLGGSNSIVDKLFLNPIETVICIDRYDNIVNELYFVVEENTDDGVVTTSFKLNIEKSDGVVTLPEEALR